MNDILYHAAFTRSLTVLGHNFQVCFKTVTFVVEERIVSLGVCHAVCVSAALFSAAKVMRCIQCSLVYESDDC